MEHYGDQWTRLRPVLPPCVQRSTKGIPPHPHDRLSGPGLSGTTGVTDITANARTGQHLPAHERQPALADPWDIGYG